MKHLIFRLLFVLVLLASSCHGTAPTYVSHPDAINSADSMFYDSVTAAKTIIDTAREQLNAKVLPESVRPALNRLIDAWNIASPAYLIWHDALKTGTASAAQLETLNRNIDALMKAIVAFKGAK